MHAADTSPQAAVWQTAAIRSLSPAERVELAAKLSAALREAAAEGWRRRNPALTMEQARRRVARAILGEELADRVWARDAP